MAKKDQFQSNFMPNSIKSLQISEGKTAYLEVWYTFLDPEQANSQIKKSTNYEGHLYSQSHCDQGECYNRDKISMVPINIG